MVDPDSESNGGISQHIEGDHNIVVGRADGPVTITVNKGPTRVLQLLSIPRLMAAGAIAVVASLVAAQLISGDTPPPKMDGATNIAVAAIDASSIPKSQTGGEDVGRSIGISIATALDNDLPKEIQVWGPEKVLPVLGSHDQMRRRAIQVADEQAADIVIYGTATAATVQLMVTIRDPDRLRAANPALLERLLGGEVVQDPKRIDSVEDARTNFPGLATMVPISTALQELDRDRYGRAIDILHQAQEALPPTESTESATLWALTGLVELRYNESGNRAALADAIESLTTAVGLDPGFEFAKLMLLGARYLEIIGGSPDSIDLTGVDPASLGDLRAEALVLKEGADPSSLLSLQATNLLGAMDIVRASSTAPTADDPVNRLDSAKQLLLTVSDSQHEGNAPEFTSVVAFARANLGLVSYRQGDIDAAIDWYTEARDLAPPIARSSYQVSLGALLLEAERGCDARTQLSEALAARTEDRPNLTTAQGELATALAAQASMSCSSGDS